MYANMEKVIKESRKYLTTHYDMTFDQLNDIRDNSKGIFEMIGTAFRKQIWSLLKDIPYGEVVTYKYISKKIAELQAIDTMSSQAVGGAVGHNPLLIFIPCHRVIGTNGSLTGYAAGLENKRFLLNFESNNNNNY